MIDLLGAHPGVASQPSAANSVPGRIKGALHFNGRTDSVCLGSDPVFNPASITVSAWVQGGSVPYMVFTRDKQGGRSYAFGHDDKQAFMQINGRPTLNIDHPLDGEWHHIVWQGGKESGWKIFVDGALIGSRPWFPMNETPVTATYIGRREHDDSEAFYDGDIDEVRVYNRVLTPKQIWNLYLAGSKN